MKPPTQADLIAVVREHRKAARAAGHLLPARYFRVECIAQPFGPQTANVHDAVTDRLIGSFPSRDMALHAITKAIDTTVRREERSRHSARSPIEKTAAAKSASTDPALWTTRRVFGPDEVVLTDEGHARAFSVGAQVRRGACAEALEALAEEGGEGYTSVLVGTRHTLTALGRYDQIAWGHLRALGYVESFDRDGVRLTERGRSAVRRGRDERDSLLERCRRAARSAS